MTRTKLTPRGKLVITVLVILAAVGSFALGMSPWVWDHVPWAVR